MHSVSQKTPQDSSVDTQGYPSLEIVFSDPDAGMEIVRYQNGTCSIRDLSCGQTMHSRVGPEVESKIVYADAARVSERLHRKDLVLWDVGMGTGANVTATLDEIEENHGQAASPAHRLRIHSFENDPRGLRLMLKRPELFPSIRKWSTTLQRLLNERDIRFPLRVSPSSIIEVHWTLHEGDFYSRMNEAEIPDLIYFDFYARKAHPDLWTKERFSEIRRLLGDSETELFTYSAATPVRLAMLLGGFFVGYGPRTPMKAETTIAATKLSLLSAPLDETWRRKLDVSSSVSEPADRAAGLTHEQWRKPL